MRIDSRLSLASPIVARDDSAVFAIGTTFHDELVRYDEARRQFVPLWGGAPAVDVAFSHNGRFAAYISYPDLTLWICNADGTERRQITKHPLASNQPHWSPSDTEISFMARMPSEPWRDYLVSAAGGPIHEILPTYPLEQGPATWSKDASQMVFGELQARHDQTMMEIRLLELAHKRPAVLPESRGKWNPRWSPDGRFILATGTDFGSLWLFELATSHWRILTRMTNINSPEWTGDSKLIQFAASSQGKFGIYRISVGSEKVQYVADLPRDDEYISLSVAPDGSPITIRQVRTDQIYRIDWKRSGKGPGRQTAKLRGSLDKPVAEVVLFRNYMPAHSLSGKRVVDGGKTNHGHRLGWAEFRVRWSQ